MRRFISTHPDDDHIKGLNEFEDTIGVWNFYCVSNSATKTDATDDFKQYCLLGDGDKHFYLIVHEKHAEIVRMIFRLYLNGYSLNRIAKELKVLATPSPTGKETWSNLTLNRILSNEKYTRNVLLQKTYVKDYISAKQLKNTGQRDQYYFTHHHAAIISQVEFDKVQQEKKRRSNVVYTEQGEQIRSKTRYSSNPISGLLICEECGSSNRRITRDISEGEKIIWRCASRVEHGKEYCKSSPTVSQQQVENALFKTFGVFPPDQDLLRKVVQQITVTPDDLRVDLAKMDDITRPILLRRQEYQLCQAYLSGDTRALEYLFEWKWYEWHDDFAELESEQVADFLLGAVNESQRQIIVEKLFCGKTLVEIGRERISAARRWALAITVASNK